MVPNNNFPSSAFSLTLSTLSNIHLILLAEKYGLIIKPVFFLKISLSPRLIKSSQIDWDCRDCHTIAL